MALFHDVRPQAVVRCATAADVGETLAFARRTGQPTAIRSGGHCFAGRSSTAGIVLDVSPLSSVRVAGELATVGAGTRLGDLYDELAAARSHARGRLRPLGRDRGPDARRRARAARPHLRADLRPAGRRPGRPGRRAGRRVRRAARPRPLLGAARRGRRDPRRRHVARAAHASGAGRDELPPHLAGRRRAGRRRGLAGVGAGRAGRPGRQPPAQRRRATAPGRPSSRWPGRCSAALRRPRRSWTGWSRRWARPRPPRRAATRGIARPSATWPRPATTTPATSSPTASRSSSTTPCPPRRSPRWSASSSRGGSKDRPVSWTSRRGPARTTACPPAPPPSCTAATASCSSTGPSSARTRRAPSEQAARRWLRDSHALLHRWGTGRAYPNFPDPDVADWATSAYGANRDGVLRIKARYAPSAPAR